MRYFIPEPIPFAMPLQTHHAPPQPYNIPANPMLLNDLLKIGFVCSKKDVRARHAAGLHNPAQTRTTTSPQPPAPSPGGERRPALQYYKARTPGPNSMTKQ
jgi:hypothetical protein